jgi:hypothetical protein
VEAEGDLVFAEGDLVFAIAEGDLVSSAEMFPLERF